MRVIALARGAPVLRTALLLATPAGALPVAITAADLAAAGAFVADFVAGAAVVFFGGMMAASFPSTTRCEYASNLWSQRLVPRPSTECAVRPASAHGSATGVRRQQFIGRCGCRKVIEKKPGSHLSLVTCHSRPLIRGARS